MKENLDLTIKILGVIGGCFTVIAGLVGGFLFIKKRWTARVDKRNRFYSGNWNNQGQITNVPSHYVDVDAGATKNKFNGYFNVRKGDDEQSWELFKMCGKRHFGKLKCKILKVVNGEEKVMAKGLLKRKDATLKWRLISSKSDQFPKEALLRKGLPKIA